MSEGGSMLSVLRHALAGRDARAPGLNARLRPEGARCRLDTAPPYVYNLRFGPPTRPATVFAWRRGLPETAGVKTLRASHGTSSEGLRVASLTLRRISKKMSERYTF